MVQWGHDFRNNFRHISKLHAIEVRNSTTDVFTLSGPVDRPNIKIIVKKRLPLTGGKTIAEGSFHDVLNPYIEEL